LTGSALAAGGSSIAAAPTMVYGQQEFGNTATDGIFTAHDGYASWWQLPLIAGDHLTLDFEGAGVQCERIWPVGTNDFNLNGATPVQVAITGSNGKQEVTLTASQDGSMPLEFQAGWPDCDKEGSLGPTGPYDFIANVQHALVVSLSVSKVNRRTHRTTFGLSLHNPDGATVSSPSLRYDVQHRAGTGGWQTTSNLRPTFAFSYRWAPRQRGKWQYIRVQVHGPGYLTTTSRTLRVRGL
jgi:hypothetical protein